MSNIGIGILAGFIVASVVCGIVAMKHKPVKTAKTANNYLDKNKVNITKREDFFVNSTVTKEQK